MEKEDEKNATSEQTHNPRLSLYVGMIFFLINFLFGFFYGFNHENIYVFISSFISLFIGLHLISFIRVSLKYKAILTPILPQIEKFSISFFNLKCKITTEGKINTFILYLPGYCPYYFWIVFSWGIPMGGTPPEHYQIWKSTPWCKKQVYLNLYDYSRYFKYGLIGRISKRIVGMPVEKKFSIVDEYITERIPTINTKISPINHLVKIGFARYSGETILLAILNHQAPPREILSVIDILDEIEKMKKKFNENLK